jgi:hypothetical protein
LSHCYLIQWSKVIKIWSFAKSNYQFSVKIILYERSYEFFIDLIFARYDIKIYPVVVYVIGEKNVPVCTLYILVYKFQAINYTVNIMKSLYI